MKHRSVIPTALLAVIMAVSIEADAARQAPFRTGVYARITKSPTFPEGGREWGALDITARGPGFAVFDLEVTMNPVAQGDGGLTRNGVIERASAPSLK